MRKLSSYLIGKGLRRGLLGGEAPWLVLGATALALRIAWRVLRRKPQVVFSEKMAPGERLTVTHRLRTGNNRHREQ
jgi:hypothetical protein